MEYNNQNNYNTTPSYNYDTDTNTQQGLKAILCEEVVLKSFLFMVGALLITACAALTISPYAALRLLSGGSFYVIVAAELGIVIASNFALRKNNAILAGILFTAYSYLTGVTLSIIFMVYTTASIVTIFLTTAAIFAIMAVYGLVTKTDLSRVGNILLMALIGIIIISFVNIFLLHSSMLDTAISAIGVLIFVGLTAYDTQKIKRMVAVSNSQNVNSLALFGAFELYLDFINLFLKLLSLLGKRK